MISEYFSLKKAIQNDLYTILKSLIGWYLLVNITRVVNLDAYTLPYRAYLNFFQVFVCTLLPFLILPVIRFAEMSSTPLSRFEKIMTFVTAPIAKFSFYMVRKNLHQTCWNRMLLFTSSTISNYLFAVAMIKILVRTCAK